MFGGVIQTSTTVASQEYYIVYNHVGNSMSEAKTLATTVKMSGGAGYVIEKNKKFYVTLCAYQNKEDATEVANKNQGSDVMKYGVEFDSVTNDDFKKEIFDIANKLYGLAMEYESKAITEEEVKAQVSILKKQLEDKFSGDHSSYSEKLYFHLTSLDNIINASESNLCWILRYEQIKFIVTC